MISTKANYSKRTYTIRKQDNKNRTTAKYRTNKLTANEFENMEYYTEIDWVHFLRTSLYYHQVS